MQYVHVEDLPTDPTYTPWRLKYVYAYITKSDLTKGTGTAGGGGAAMVAKTRQDDCNCQVRPEEALDQGHIVGTQLGGRATTKSGTAFNPQNLPSSSDRAWVVGLDGNAQQTGPTTDYYYRANTPWAWYNIFGQLRCTNQAISLGHPVCTKSPLVLDPAEEEVAAGSSSRQCRFTLYYLWKAFDAKVKKLLNACLKPDAHACNHYQLYYDHPSSCPTRVSKLRAYSSVCCCQPATPTTTEECDCTDVETWVPNVTPEFMGYMSLYTLCDNWEAMLGRFN